MSLSYKTLIDNSRKNIKRAFIIANNRKFACAEAKRIYTKDARGMYKHLESQATKCLFLISAHNLTTDKPYFIVDKTMFGLINMQICPLRGV